MNRIFNINGVDMELSNEEIQDIIHSIHSDELIKKLYEKAEILKLERRNIIINKLKSNIK